MLIWKNIPPCFGKPGLATNMRDEASCYGQATTRDKKWSLKERDQPLRERRRAELSNSWGKWWSLEKCIRQQSRAHDMNPWRLQRYETSSNKSAWIHVMKLLLLVLINCIALQWLEPHPRLSTPSEADMETGGDVWAVERVRCLLRWGLLDGMLSPQFYEKFKGKHEVISSRKADNPPGWKRGFGVNLHILQQCLWHFLSSFGDVKIECQD